MGTLDGREDLVLGIEDECRWVDENTTARVHGQIAGEEDEIAGGSPPRSPAASPTTPASTERCEMRLEMGDTPTSRRNG